VAEGQKGFEGRGAGTFSPVAIISLAQLFGTSLWFSANSAAEGLARDWGASAGDIALLTTAVQAGFILGTLTLSLTGLADRFRASAIFVTCALAGAACNAAFAWWAGSIAEGAALRLLVGVSLAGIYPIGMKLVVSWEPARTGQALALLVAMLTLGTALPHLLRASGAGLDWRWIVTASSLLALAGVGMIRALGDGPHLPPRRTDAGGPRRSVLGAFRVPQFRAAATGYFGHMWELYAFWTLVPLLVAASGAATGVPGGVAGLSFAIIGIGAAGCLLGGRMSRRFGSGAVALTALALSGSCAAVFALAWDALPGPAVALLLLLWGAAVVADSPQFSALSAAACPRDLVGSALAIQNAIGFAITILSIWAAAAVLERLGASAAAWLLVPGPVLGLLGYAAARRSRRTRND
jgi:predicted MFS family arabinose efflux permease